MYQWLWQDASIRQAIPEFFESVSEQSVLVWDGHSCPSMFLRCQNGDEQLRRSDGQFGRSDGQLRRGDGQFGRGDGQLRRSDGQECPSYVMGQVS